MTLWVLKLGTSLLRGDAASAIQGYSNCIANAIAAGDRVVLVTSGAVGLGCQQLQLAQRPDRVVALQAAAAIGQGHLMALYDQAMARHGISVAQVLLTRSDLVDRVGGDAGHQRERCTFAGGTSLWRQRHPFGFGGGSRGR
jgi:glutamate 5-kinase